MEEQQPLLSAPSLWKTLTRVFVSPSEFFLSLKNASSSSLLWAIPLIVSLIIASFTVFTTFTNEALKKEMKDGQHKAIQQMVDNGKLSKVQAVLANIEVDSMGNMIMVYTIVITMLKVVVYYFGGALVLWLANKIMFNSIAGYRKHLELYGAASWIGVLGNIVSLIMMVEFSSMAATPSATLAVFGSYDLTNKLHILLSSINIFFIWKATVIGIGLSKLSGKSTKAGIGVALVLWCVWVAVFALSGIAL